MTERRAKRRYEVCFPIVVRAIDQGQSLAYEGRTRDISTSAMHFSLDLPLEPGSAINFTITMPAELTGGTRVLIRGSGKVLWACRCREAGYGIASTIETYEISRDRVLVTMTTTDGDAQ